LYAILIKDYFLEKIVKVDC